VIQQGIQVTFLGTGTSTGIPMIGCTCEVCTSADPRDNRLRSSIAVSNANTSIVIDSGPDFRQQMLRAKINKLDAIIYTHPHKDHVAGMDDVRAYNYFQQKAMDLYANEMTQEVLVREFPYVFSESKYPGVPDVRLNTIDSEPFTVGDMNILPVEVWHLKMPVLGFRIGGFTYITDANRIELSEMEKIRGSEVLVINALRREKHISHFTLDEAISLSQKLDVKTTYFTHISHQLGLHAEVEADLPENMFLAYDGLSFSV
jgi:phosphoribosyl 1,2-cyclic phosphate phosphodiesterase